jgi:predicted enzyme related to lactoylglutathione lyase
MKRAMEFYSQVLNTKFQVMDMGKGKFAIFPFERGVASGALVESPDRKPGSGGTLIYLDGGDDLSVPLKTNRFSRRESSPGEDEYRVQRLYGRL